MAAMEHSLQLGHLHSDVVTPLADGHSLGLHEPKGLGIALFAPHAGIGLMGV